MQKEYKLTGLNSVKRLSDGAFIPFANGNADYEEYKLWLAEGNVPEPEFTVEELKVSTLNKQIQEAKAYLSDTDWYITRKMETGVEIPLEVLTKRAEARLLV